MKLQLYRELEAARRDARLDLRFLAGQAERSRQAVEQLSLQRRQGEQRSHRVEADLAEIETRLAEIEERLDSLLRRPQRPPVSEHA